MPWRVLPALMLFLACGRERAEGDALLVYAASSLTEALPAAGGSSAGYRFDASSKLAHAIEAGAPADVFVSADADWMDYLQKRGLVTDRVTLVRNRLVAVVRSDAASLPSGPAELAWVPRLALAGEGVPAGRYARAALKEVLPEAHVVSGDSVRTALAWVARGEADAAVVYATDALVEPRVRVAFTFPEASHPPIVFVAGVVAASPRAAEARAFLARLGSAPARQAFHAAGFLPP